MNTFSTSQAIQFGWRKTKEHFSYLVGLMILLVVVSILLNTLASIPILGLIVVIAGQALLGVGLTRIMLSLKRGQRLPYKTLVTTVEPYWRYLGASVLSGLLIAAGFILLIVPGIILAIILMFVKYVVVDTDKGVIESLSRSASMTRGYRWQLFWFVIVTTIINILGALLFGVGLLITMPVTLLASVYIYDQLRDLMEEEDVSSSVHPDTTPQKPVGENNL